MYLKQLIAVKENEEAIKSLKRQELGPLKILDKIVKVD